MPERVVADTLSAICDAIRQRRCISFVYAERSRLIEPHACGRTEAGNLVVSGWLVSGYSASGAATGWRTYLLAEISGLRFDSQHFLEPRPGYNPHGIGWSAVLCCLEEPEGTSVG